MRGRLTEAIKAKIIEIDDAVVVSRDDDGKVKLQQAASAAGVGAAGGAVWGGLIGLLFLAPLVGMAIGAAAGAAAERWPTMASMTVHEGAGRKTDSGSAALIVLVRSMTPDKILPNIQEQGHVIQSSLSNEAEAQLNEALAAAGRELAETIGPPTRHQRGWPDQRIR